MPWPFHMRLPVYAVIDGEERYLGLLGVTGSKPLAATLTIRQRPDKVVLDPHRSILAEINQ